MSPDRGDVAVVALFGPTAVGKTAVAVALAGVLRSRGEDPVAISADAFQIYRGLELLSGAPSAAERDALEHRLVSCVPVTESFSAGRFAALAHREIDAALTGGRRPIVVGGTGLYLRAALAELDLAPPPPPRLRARLEAEAAEHGVAALHSRLAEREPAVAARIAPTDRSRVIRGLELAEMAVAPRPDGAGSQLWTDRMRHPTLLVGLTMRRELLDARIDARVEAIAAAGAADEVRRAVGAGASATARKALGFDELGRGDVDALKRRTRRLARRQLTWMRKLGGVEVIDVGEMTSREIAESVAARL